MICSIEKFYHHPSTSVYTPDVVFLTISITDILKICRVVMVTSNTAEDNSHEDDDLIYAGEYLTIAKTSKTNYTKGPRVRRLICRVCRLKFRTRQETQAHIRHEHRRVQANGYWKLISNYHC